MRISDIAQYAVTIAAVLGVLFLLSYGVIAISLVLFRATGTRLPDGHRLGRGSMRLLKSFHILCASSWIGSAVTMVVLSLVTSRALEQPCALRVLAIALNHADQWVVVPMALGTIASGLLLAFFSGFGFRYPWVISKAAGGFWALVVGWFMVTPIVRGLQESWQRTGNLSGDPLFPPTYYIVGGVQASLLLGLLLLSVFKPWHSGSLLDD